jgi:hypothetical protein
MLKLMLINLASSLELGAWSLELGAWSLELGAWSLELGAWSLESMISDVRKLFMKILLSLIKEKVKIVISILT